MNEDAKELVEIRDPKESDRNFILATWLRGLYYGNSWFNEIDKDIFMLNYHKVLENLLTSEFTQVRIASLKDDSDTILGYAVIEPRKSALHWVYVKAAWRKLGIAKMLLPDSERWIMVTHLTDLGKVIKPENVIFNPFAL